MHDVCPGRAGHALARAFGAIWVRGTTRAAPLKSRGAAAWSAGADSPLADLRPSGTERLVGAGVRRRAGSAGCRASFTPGEPGAWGPEVRCS
jgi:hypothetical protein